MFFSAVETVFLPPSPNPTPKSTPYRKHTVFLDFQKKFIMFNV